MTGSAARTRILQRLLASSAPTATLLVRIAVGVIFASEGIQKFLDPDALGAGRFAEIGIPAPDVMGPFVGAVEIVGGLLVLGGLFIRLASIALVIDMLVAIASTKVPMLIGRGYFLFAEPPSTKHGLWSMLHEARTDLAMLLACMFLFVVGAGARSLDARLAAHTAKGPG